MPVCEWKRLSNLHTLVADGNEEAGGSREVASCPRPTECLPRLRRPGQMASLGAARLAAEPALEQTGSCAPLDCGVPGDAGVPAAWGMSAAAAAAFVAAVDAVAGSDAASVVALLARGRLRKGAECCVLVT